MSRLPLLLALGACSTPDAAAPELSPPPTFELVATTDVVAGTTLLIDVDSTLGEDEQVLFGLGLGGAGSGPCPPVLGGACLGILSPTLAGTGLIGLDGTTTLQLDLPVSLPSGATFAIQGAVVRGGGGSRSVLSNVLQLVVTDPVPPSVDFVYSGAPEPYIVPAGVTSIRVLAWGAEGGAGGDPGGLGGEAIATLPTTPGERLEVRIGGRGGTSSDTTGGGYNGGAGVRSTGGQSPSGSGGGATDIRRAPYGLDDRLLVAAGGGGGGDGAYQSFGGDGGGFVGEDGSSNHPTFGGGGGGTQTAGGAVSWATSTYPNEPGTFGAGGECYHDNAGCGGGGGGWYGGAGGSFTGGGGGSSYISAGATNTSTVSGVRSGAGLLLIEY